MLAHAWQVKLLSRPAQVPARYCWLGQMMLSQTRQVLSSDSLVQLPDLYVFSPHDVSGEHGRHEALLEVANSG